MIKPNEPFVPEYEGQQQYPGEDQTVTLTQWELFYIACQMHDDIVRMDKEIKSRELSMYGAETRAYKKMVSIHKRVVAMRAKIEPLLHPEQMEALKETKEIRSKR